MFKKIIIFLSIFSFIMNIGGNELIAYAQDSSIKEISQNQVKQSNPEDFEYHERDGELNIIRYNGNDIKVVIPSSIDGKVVTGLSSNIFENTTTTTEVFVPNTIKEMRKPLGRNKSIVKVEFEEGLVRIPDYALTNSANITDVIIPDSVTMIGMWAFEGCTNLTELQLPPNLDSISDEAFKNCTGLINLKIPHSVTRIGDRAFYGIEFEEFILPQNIYVMGSSILNSSKITKLKIPKSAKYMYSSTFGECENLEEVEFEEGMKNIPSKVLIDCKNVKKVIIPDSVRTIGSSSFKGCRSLSEVQLPNSLESIESEAFRSCVSMTTVDLPNSLTYIGSYAFSGIELEEFIIPPKVSKIISNVINSSKITKLKIPKSVTQVYSDAFSGCKNLEEVEFEEGKITIPSNIFGGCKNLKKVIIPNSIKSIGAMSFENCISLSEIILPENLKEINYDAFKGCTNLKSVTIPKSVTSMAKGIFDNIEDFTMYVYKNSYSQTYAEANNIKFVLLESDEEEDKEEVIKPAKVIDFKTSNVFSTSIKLTWSPVEDADGYEVYRATSLDGQYTLRRTVYNDSPLSYTNTGLSTGKTYYYKVRAFKEVDKKKIDGDFSDVIYATPKLSTPKASASSSTYSSNKISWNSVTNAHGYEVYRATSKTGKYELRKDTTSTTYTNTGLTTNKTYYYKVKAYRIVNNKKVYSKESSVVYAMPVFTTPSVKLSLGDKRVYVRWNKIAGATNYQVYRATSRNGTYTLKRTVSSSTTSYTNTDVSKNKGYYYKVRAYRVINGKKIYSNFSDKKYIKTK